MGRERRSASEVRKILRGYEESRLTRRQYCAQIGIPVTTLDYYRSRWQGGSAGKQAEKRLSKNTPALEDTSRTHHSLIRVELSAPTEPPPNSNAHFTITLVAQGQPRRIEISAGRAFDEVLLGKLIRIVETA